MTTNTLEGLRKALDEWERSEEKHSHDQRIHEGRAIEAKDRKMGARRKAAAIREKIAELEGDRE